MTSHASREFMEKPMGHFQYSTSSIYVTIFIYCRQCANISEHRKWYWNFYWHKSWFEVSTSRTYSDAVVPLGHKLFYVDITFSICSFFWGGGMAMCWNIICSSIFLSLGLHCCHCTSETRCYCFCRKWWYWYFTIWSLANTSNIHSRPLKVIVILWPPLPQLLSQKQFLSKYCDGWFDRRLDVSGMEENGSSEGAISMQFQFYGFDCLLSGSVVSVFFFLDE